MEQEEEMTEACNKLIKAIYNFTSALVKKKLYCPYDFFEFDEMATVLGSFADALNECAEEIRKKSD